LRGPQTPHEVLCHCERSEAISGRNRLKRPNRPNRRERIASPKGEASSLCTEPFPQLHLSLSSLPSGVSKEAPGGETGARPLPCSLPRPSRERIRCEGEFVLSLRVGHRPTKQSRSYFQEVMSQSTNELTNELSYLQSVHSLTGFQHLLAQRNRTLN
jgi:hypothetical protein